MNNDTARILTLKEVHESSRYSGAMLWLETRGHMDICRYSDQRRIFEAKYTKLNLLSDEHEISCPDSEYGKIWRCWSTQPDKAQREAEPWQS